MLLRPLPARFTPWTQVFDVLRLILGLLAASRRRSDLQNAVDALRLLDDHKATFARVGLALPLMPRGPDAWHRFVDWATEYAGSVAGA